MKGLDEQLKEQMKNSGSIEIDLDEYELPQTQQVQMQDQMQQNGGNAQPVEGEKAKIEQNQVKLDNKIEEVNENMPDPIPQEIVEKISVAKHLHNDRRDIPNSLRSVIETASQWRKVSENTSAPIKAIADAFLNATNEQEAAMQLGFMYNACVNYLYLNDNKWFKSSKRKQEVRDILVQIAEFSKDASTEYLDQLSKQVDNSKMAYDENDDVRKYIDKFELDINQSLSSGQEGETDLETELEKRKQADKAAEEAEDETWAKYDGFASFVLSTELKDSISKATTAKAPLKLSEKKYETDDDLVQQMNDLKQALDFVAQYKDPMSMSRKKLLMSSEGFRKAFLQCKEIDELCKKNGIALMPDEKELVDTYKSTYPYLERFISNTADLITGPAFISLQQKGFKIPEGDGLAPVMTVRELKLIAGRLENREELNAYEKLIQITKDWNAMRACNEKLVVGQTTEYYDAIRKAPEMTDEELLKADRKYDLMWEQTESYFDKRAREEKNTAGDSWSNNIAKSVAIKLNVVRDNDPEENYQLYKDLRTDIAYLKGKDDDEKAENLVQKAKAIEIVFDTIRSFEISDFSIRKGEKFCGRLDKRYAMLSLAVDAKKLLVDYDEALKHELFPEDSDLRYGEEERADLVAKVEALNEIAKLYGSKPADDIDIDAEDILEGYEVEKQIKLNDIDKAEEVSQKVLTKMDIDLEERLERNDEALINSAQEMLKERTEEENVNLKRNLSVKSEQNLTKEQKEANEKILTANVNKSIDARVKFRTNIPLDIKKKVDYPTFERLADFAYFSGGEEMLKTLISEYAQGKRNKDKRSRQYSHLLDKEDHSKEINRENYAVLDIMTAQLMKVNVGAFDISNDEAVARNAIELDKLAGAVEVYQRLINEGGGDQYFEHLSQKDSDVMDLGELMKVQLEKLISLTRYYRVRKLLIEDEEYIYENTDDMFEDVQDSDSYERKRLKQLLAQSRMYAKNIRRMKNGKNLELSSFDDTYTDEEAVRKLEAQRYSVAPRWMQESFSLTHIKTKNTQIDASGCCTINKQNYNMYYNNAESKREGNKELYDKFQGLRTKFSGMTNGGSPVFTEGYDRNLWKIELGDDWARLGGSFANAFSYRRTNSEVLEMSEILKMQKTHEWNSIKDDPEALEFYESAYKEKAMMFVSMTYSNVKRVANSIGLKTLFMHPIDLNMQMTNRLRMQIMGAVNAGNIDMEANRPRIEKLFNENNKDGKYLFDAEDLWELAGITDMIAWKTVNVGQSLNQIILGGSEDIVYKGASKEEVNKAIFGVDDVRTKAEEEYDEFCKKSGIDPLEEKIDLQDFYLHKHPEIFNAETYMKKTKKGEFIMGRNIQYCTHTMMNTSSLGDVINAIDKKRLNALNPKEMEIYKKSVNDRGLPMNFTTDDPYGMESFEKGYKNFIIKDEKGNITYRDISKEPVWDSATGKVIPKDEMGSDDDD